ncbi:MAG TPA: lipoprotein-releasing ABC transporter permease subunit [Alphaproteobacteria bacterium]|nr:lipoprotein-releasing ABC transporter permease subunit [Alphaproteobacteria bacterium]
MIFSPFERMVAMRYLRAKRQEGFVSVIAWFSLIGIAIGVATLIVVMSVMNGFRHDLFQRILGLNGHINVYAMDGNLVNYQPVLERIEKVPGVLSVSPTVEAQALVAKNGAANGVYVRGVAPEAFRHRPTVANHIVVGSLQNFGGDQIAIGIRLADRLGVTVGDSITLISPQSKTTVFGAAPRMRAYKIAAIFDVGMYEYDNNFVFMPLPAAQIFFMMGQGVSSLEIFVSNPMDLHQATMNLVAALDAPGMPRMRLLDWKQNNASFVNALQTESSVMFLILTLIIVVAAFNIISSLIMLVKDKTRDIAILRTMGATRGMIMRIFFLNGALIGIVGTFLGLLLGIAIATHLEDVRQWIQHFTHTDLFSPEIYFLTHLPSIVDWHEVVRVAAMALGLSFLATLYPAWRAAKLDPVEALRYE